jgi:hypothetical protein
MESNASAHFKNFVYSNITKKCHMTCIYCNKVLIDSKNSTCKVSHLYSCRPDKAMQLKNKSKYLTAKKRTIQITIETPQSHIENNSNEEKKTIKALLSSKTPYAYGSKEHIELTDSVLNCIVKMNLPISIVDEPSFIIMLSAFNNRLKLPCRQTLSKTLIPEKAKQAKALLKSQLDVVNYCSLTCDGWTSEGNHSYLGK